MKNENTPKVVIVGSGLGGLFSAAKLATAGFKVTVIEGHYNIGGYASSFKRGKSTHEVAIHCLDGFREGSLKHDNFKKLGIFDHVDFVRTPEFYNFRLGGLSIKVPDDRELALKTLKHHFPTQREGLEEFFSIIEGIESEVQDFRERDEAEDDIFLYLRFPLIGKYKDLSVADFLETRFTDMNLKLILMSNIQFYHDDPAEMDFLTYAYSNSFYFNYGQYFIKGSSQELGNYLKKLVLSNKGEFLLGTLVNGLEIERNEIKAVKTFKRSSEERNVVTGDVFIFNNPPTEVERWVNQKEYLSIGPFPSKKYSKSACTLYLEFDQKLSDFGHEGYVNYFIHPNLGGVGQKYLGFGLIDYSQIDSGLGHGGRFIASIVFMANYEDWFELSLEDYKEKKNKVVDDLLFFLDEIYPGLKSSCLRAELATPLTMERYTYNPDGAVYAFSPLSRNILSEELIQNNLKNGYFASAWAYLSGFSGASISGIKTANKIIEKYIPES